jgi:hypothetical protein
MSTSQKSDSIFNRAIFTSALFSLVAIFVTETPSNALGDIVITNKCTAPFFVFGHYEQNCTEYTYAPNGGNGNGNGNGNNVNIGNNNPKGETTRTGGSGSYRLINVRQFRRRVS